MYNLVPTSHNKQHIHLFPEINLDLYKGKLLSFKNENKSHGTGLLKGAISFGKITSWEPQFDRSVCREMF